MERKRTFFARMAVFLAFILMTNIAYAQDKVELKDGSTISCNIKEITEKNVIFQQEGVKENTTMPISEILTITYANGEKDVFGTKADETEKKDNSELVEIKPPMRDEKSSEFIIRGGISFNNWAGKDIKNSDFNIGFNLGIEGHLYVTNNLFCGFNCSLSTKGYKLNYSDSSGSVWDEDGMNYDVGEKETFRTYNLDIPIFLGYKVGLYPQSSIKFMIGPYVTYALSGQKEIKGSSTYYSDIHSSETEYYNRKDKIDYIKDFNKFGAGLYAAASFNYKRFSLGIAYERGFTKLIKETKQYENNFMITIGYNLN